MVFHWRLSDSKSPQLSRTLPSILAVLNNVVVWMVSTRLPTSKSSSPCSKSSSPLVTVPNAPIIIGIIFTCMFHWSSIPWLGQGYYYYYNYYYYYLFWDLRFFTIFSYQPLKNSFHKKYTLIIQCQYTYKIRLIHLIVHQNTPPNSLSYHLFWKHPI